MPQHSEQKILPYTAEQLFDMVGDVEQYPKFLPWCVSCRIKDKKDDYFLADLVVGYKVIREKFTSKVFLNPQSKEIKVEYQDGPMRYLKNHWRFMDQKNGSCEVSFFVDFEFKNIILQKLMGVFFDEIIKRMVGAFEGRAQELYAKK